jgi:hypothetical protein
MKTILLLLLPLQLFAQIRLTGVSDRIIEGEYFDLSLRALKIDKPTILNANKLVSLNNI